MYGLFMELGHVFMQLVNISITAGWLVLAVMLLRLLLRRAPKWVTCLLWGIVAVRLLLPISLESPVSLVPNTETLPVTNIYSPDPGVADNPYYHQVDSGVEVFDAVVSPMVNDVNPTAMRANFSIFGCVWLAGMVAMLVYTVISYLRLHRRTREGVEWERGVWLCDRIDTPFILGIVKPRIFLPTAMGAGDKVYVLAHEKAHLRRGDHLWKPLGFALLTVYWYNPVLWVAYILLCRDIELACDEKVICRLGEESKAAYSNALINCSAPRRLVAACPLAFGEVGVKDRIRSVLHYKKPAFWVVVTAVVASLVLAVCFLTDPVKGDSWISDRSGLFVHTISAECDNVTYSLLDVSAVEKDSYIQVEWENDTPEVLCFGQEYALYKDGEPYDMGTRYWDLLLYTILPRGNYIERYTLPQLPNGRYRLEKSFYFENAPDTAYRAFIDFTVDTTYSFVNNTFTLEALVYGAEGHDVPFDVNDHVTRIFSVTQHKLLSVAEQGQDWLVLGELLPVVLERKNFDDLFADTNWQGGLLAPKLRKNNLNALLVSDPTANRMAYLLEQKNGDIYIAYGRTDIHQLLWVFKLKGTYNGYLTNRYPELLGLPTTKGLEVYVTKFSGTGYRCTLKSGKNLGYSAEELINSDFTDIKDMAAILTTYDLPPEMISVIPYQHPLSSFLWTDAEEELPLIEALLGLYGKDTAVVRLEDKAETQNILTDSALEFFYEDEKHEYYFPSIRSQYVVVHLKNGKEVPVTDALQQGLITIADLDRYGIIYYCEQKPDYTSPPALDVVSRGEKQRAWQGGYTWTCVPEGDGVGQQVVADAASALQAVQAGEIPPWTVSVAHYDASLPPATLYFGLAPDEVMVDIYRLEANGEWRQTVTHVLMAVGDSLTLMHGDCLYVITATWRQKADGAYYGSATYAFRAGLVPMEKKD